MKNLSFKVFACLSFVLLPAAAFAETDGYRDGNNYDNWRGGYLGANVGGIVGDFVGHGTTGPSGSSFDATPGVQGGFNLQSGPWVYGGEVDTAWTPLQGSSSAGGRYHEDWTSTVRGRVGYAMNHWLPYFTAGLGITNGDFNPPSGGTRDTMQLGLALGGGAEYMLRKNTSLRLQYLHVDVPNESNDIGGTSVNGGSENHIVTAGINWHFD